MRTAVSQGRIFGLAPGTGDNIARRFWNPRLPACLSAGIWGEVQPTYVHTQFHLIGVHYCLRTTATHFFFFKRRGGRGGRPPSQQPNLRTLRLPVCDLAVSAFFFSGACEPPTDAVTTTHRGWMGGVRTLIKAPAHLIFLLQGVRAVRRECTFFLGQNPHTHKLQLLLLLLLL